MRFPPPTLHSKWSSVSQNHTTTTSKKQRQRAQQGRRCRFWSFCRWYSAQFMYKIQGTVESSFICHVPHAPRTRLDASECPLRDINTHTTVSNSLLRCSSNCRFLSLGPIHQGSPRSCVHGAVTVRSRHTKNSPILVFMSSMSIPSLPRRTRSTSPCECPLQTALVPLSTTFSSLNILRVGSVPFQLPRGT